MVPAVREGAMFKDKTVGVLGAGNMGQALLRGFLESGLLEPQAVIASSLDSDVLDSLQDELGIRTTLNNAELIAGSDIILLATKPQTIVPVLSGLKDVIREGQLFLSVAAGVRTQVLEEALPLELPVVRVMPNTPSLIGQGTNAFCLGRYAGDEHARLVHALLGSAGLSVQVDEAQMDSVTAISGSGPAYVFLFMEAFYAAGEGLGLSREVARKLVNQTMRGAVELAIASEDDAAELRRKVTSPGGVTAEAIAVLEAQELRRILKEAIQAGHDRSAEMTRECDPPEGTS
jgi:pyrroline-5-carboxylate reductase